MWELFFQHVYHIMCHLMWCSYIVVSDVYAVKEAVAASHASDDVTIDVTTAMLHLVWLYWPVKSCVNCLFFS